MGTFRNFRMPFRLKGAPAAFQRALDIILSGVRWQICLVYLDDFIVFSRTHEEHADHLDTVLSLLRTAGMSLKLKRCSFFRPMVHYLGHVISPGKLSMADTAADAFKTFTFPRTLMQVRSFLGACNVYRRFVKAFAKIARPLTDITRKDAAPDYDNPTETQLQAFEDLKARMIAPPVLALPRYGWPYMIDTDASAYQLGCTLLQEHDKANDWRPVRYWSYSLNDSERNCSATERECFAVVWAVRTLRPYVEGTKFTVRTYHDALRWLMSLTESSVRLTRWRLRLAEYDLTNQYGPGRVHQVPDALSCLISPRIAENPRPFVEVDDDIPTYDTGTTVRDVSDELADHLCTASWDDEADHIFVTTRNRKKIRRSSRDRARDKPRGDDEAPALEEPDDFWAENEEFDAVDLDHTRDFEADESGSQVAPPQDDLRAPLKIEEIAEEQRVDELCQTILARQSESRDSAFFEDHQGVLKQRHPFDLDIVQVVVPRTLCARLLRLCHNPAIAGHPGQNGMYYV